MSKDLRTKEEIKNNIDIKYRKTGIFRRIFSWNDIIDNILDQIDSLESYNDKSLIEVENLQKKIEDLQKNIYTQEEGLKEQLRHNGTLESQLKDSNEEMLKYTKELHSVFKSTSGSKGKLAEIKLENILKAYFGEEDDGWVKNLSVKNGTVEFGIKVDPESSKWVPVDSKCLVPTETDENGEFLIDRKYFSSIKTEYTKITKYIDQGNTESYALMVLPSDHIYNLVFNENQEIFVESSKLGVFITSPSNFIQFVRTIDKLKSKMELVNDSKEIIDEIQIVMKHINNFWASSEKGLENLNTAFNLHKENANKKIQLIDSKINRT